MQNTVFNTAILGSTAALGDGKSALQVRYARSASTKILTACFC